MKKKKKKLAKKICCFLSLSADDLFNTWIGALSNFIKMDPAVHIPYVVTCLVDQVDWVADFQNSERALSVMKRFCFILNGK